MDIRNVDDRFAVAPQLLPEEFAAIADAGFTAAICNRPDGEEDGQPAVADLRKAAQDAGLAFHHIPVWGGEFPEGAIAAFRAIRRGTEGPVLAFCRTGTRSITLDTLANPFGSSAAERLNKAAAANYDLSSMQERLRDQD